MLTIVVITFIESLFIEVQYHNFDAPQDWNEITIGEIECHIPLQSFVDEPMIIKAFIAREIDYKGDYIERAYSLHEDTIKVGTLMKLELIDYSINNNSNFRIEPLSNTEQIIDTFFNRWEWKVTPLESGDLQLALRSTNLMNTPFGLKNLDNPNFPMSIKVQSRFFYEAKGVLKKYWYYLVIGLFGLSWLILFFSTKKVLKRIKVIPIDDFMEFELKARTLIQLGKIEKSFKLIHEFINDNKVESFTDQLNIFESHFKDNKSNFNLGIISLEDYNLNRNKVIKGVLDLVNIMKEKYTTQYPL